MENFVEKPLKPPDIVFLFSVSWKRISLKAGAVVGKFCSKRGGGSQNAHGISATCHRHTMQGMANDFFCFA